MRAAAQACPLLWLACSLLLPWACPVLAATAGPKVALLFISKGAMPLESSWQAFFDGVAGLSPPPLNDSQMAHVTQTAQVEQVAIRLEMAGQFTPNRIYQDAQCVDGDVMKEASEALAASWRARPRPRVTDSARGARLRSPGLPLHPSLARQQLFSVYVHTDPAFGGYSPGDLFYGREIEPRVKASRWQHSLTMTSILLLEAALLDPAENNVKFMVVSESDVPLYHGGLIYLRLVQEEPNRVGRYSSFRYLQRLHYDVQSLSYDMFLPNVPSDTFGKSLQWVALNRASAFMIVHDRIAEPWFETFAGNRFRCSFSRFGLQILEALHELKAEGKEVPDEPWKLRDFLVLHKRMPTGLPSPEEAESARKAAMLRNWKELRDRARAAEAAKAKKAREESSTPWWYLRLSRPGLWGARTRRAARRTLASTQTPRRARMLQAEQAGLEAGLEGTRLAVAAEEEPLARADDENVDVFPELPPPNPRVVASRTDYQWPFPHCRICRQSLRRGGSWQVWTDAEQLRLLEGFFPTAQDRSVVLNSDECYIKTAIKLYNLHPPLWQWHWERVSTAVDWSRTDREGHPGAYDQRVLAEFPAAVRRYIRGRDCNSAAEVAAAGAGARVLFPDLAHLAPNMSVSVEARAALSSMACRQPEFGQLHPLWTQHLVPPLCPLFARKFLPNTAHEAAFFTSCARLGYAKECLRQLAHPDGLPASNTETGEL